MLGILPERRRDRDRITQDSIMNWIRALLGNDADAEIKMVYFVSVEI